MHNKKSLLCLYSKTFNALKCWNSYSNNYMPCIVELFYLEISLDFQTFEKNFHPPKKSKKQNKSKIKQT